MTNLQPLLNELHLSLAALYGNRLDKIVLFGSHARGDARRDSDIDVLIVLRDKVNLGEEIRKTVPITAELSLRYNVFISCAYTTREEYELADEPLFKNVRSEGIEV